jgi:predicted  nucleic acid-binding Zn ribbon protein
LAPKVRLLGRDINSEQAAEDETPSWQVLYTTYVHTCSPLRSGETLLPIPLYRNPPTLNGDHKSVIKWQTEWQACDEIQMAGGCKAEHAALRELSEVGSDLFRRGWDIRGRIEYITQIPTYYYLYKVGGKSLEEEKARKCPKCGGEWLLDEPLHDIFYFKCDSCRIVSNISWDHLK